MTLHVLFAVRPGLHDLPGGDTVQIDRTAAALSELGVRVSVSDRADEPLGPYDLVHLWHLERVHESYLHFLRARSAGKPTVLSTIYWPWGNRPRRVPTGAAGRLRWIREDLKNVYRYLKADPARRRFAAPALRAGWGTCRQRLLTGADLLLPNSQAEADILRAEGANVRCRVVPNAVDAKEVDRISREPGEVEKRGVICVGHFDVRKNQLAAVEALRDTDVPVTFVGAGRRFHRRYYSACRRAAGANMTFLEPVEQTEVLRLLARHKVHLCPSHFETPGLANLEAGMLGSSLALGESPPVREYFGDDAEYFPPADRDALRQAVLRALDLPAPKGLADRIRERFNWRRTAEETLAAYREVLGTQ